MKSVSYSEPATGASVSTDPAIHVPGPRTAFHRFYRRGGKRALDIVLALLLMPVAAPLIALAWALARRDGGPGFYRQERVGLGGRTYHMWKIRTMVTDADKALEALCAHDPAIAREWRENQKLGQDPRVTPAGRFLRASSLDELPQIINVLLGDMSFVGPRPFMTCQSETYQSAGGRAYFHMRPGITGPWQVSGRGDCAFVDRIAYDDAYFRAVSARTDVQLLLRTVLVVARRTGR